MCCACVHACVCCRWQAWQNWRSRALSSCVLLAIPALLCCGAHGTEFCWWLLRQIFKRPWHCSTCTRHALPCIAAAMCSSTLLLHILSGSMSWSTPAARCPPYCAMQAHKAFGKARNASSAHVHVVGVRAFVVRVCARVVPLRVCCLRTCVCCVLMPWAMAFCKAHNQCECVSIALGLASCLLPVLAARSASTPTPRSSASFCPHARGAWA